MIQDTLLIRHLPSALSHQEKSELLKHFGAVDVKIVGPETKKSNLVFARFENNRAAEIAVGKLHLLNVLGERISAEFARGPNPAAVEPVEETPLNVNVEKQDRIVKAREAFLKKLGLSIKNYDFSQPPPLNIYYQYPPPTRDVLENICKAMANVPKLYNQVLHLMNKMNLPCPFTDKYPLESDLFKKEFETPAEEKVKDLSAENVKEISTTEDESEVGSEDDQQTTEIIPMKRKRTKEKKVIKRPKFTKPQITVQTSKSGLKADDVFENAPKDQVSKKIELKITSNLTSIQESIEKQTFEQTQGFQVVKVAPQKPEKQIESESMEESTSEVSVEFISADQLAANRVSSKDQKVLPVFKNYQPGAPSCRLYIKNLGKQVQSKDLHFIYRRYYRPELDQVQGSMFDIRLMQEGRMKGQAFITLQSVNQAQLALKETNGYILKDKPMVVQFARSALAK
ncbi:RNA-binding region-containing protein 3-like isoform X2 [Macrosteles quadrilineatus]|uniref:RNA-binding region-containing protein 3-like isoform X2 n=1 Tax=Macrosteles quadrilineatus TaxID=74068 RepID=UPI0023E23DA2|nr:RNA-binding region-containing protein 3-like isoform X2 [Macrosteles quadrilineatus]XP_054289008.1 RNA-binding region-containing protein 3-like isoform X2 [Macrosteles quadrilineatus]XP_054289010.1 RNA-binding region-containing protein 3-like isoform X2 [Macrosteles quadrilineatus]XP_054289011.1 RNA-binding region-containing protein 3-like isoform X2 [Macrosteles quadrilineatus]XP_054289012.1 RNA-binding region-containing protein 3-like isoform X2 [Macrosteles quadrilineatus]